MMRNNIVLTSSLSILSQLLRVVPLFYFKKGNMERVRESKKQILPAIYPLLLTHLEVQFFICFLRFSLAPLGIKFWRDNSTNRSSFQLVISPFLKPNLKGAAPLFYFKKGNMERVRKNKKADPIQTHFFLLTILSVVFICFLRFSLAPLGIKI